MINDDGKSQLITFLIRKWALIFLILEIILFSILAGGFFSLRVFQIILFFGTAIFLLGTAETFVIITGGIAHSKRFVDRLKAWITFLCKKFYVYPGEGEMEALALGVLRVLRKEETAKSYQ